MRIGILISGRGSNMLALAEAAAEGHIPEAEIGVVISDQTNADGLRHARDRGLSAIAIPRGNCSRSQHDNEIVAALQTRGVQLVCLAGYMRVLSSEFFRVYAGRTVNIHPSLLPSFPGLHAQRQALDYGVKWTGCTVHFVDDTLDGGPIIAQKPVPVFDDDTEESLSNRILKEEHLLYPAAVSRLVRGEFSMSGRRVLQSNV